MKKIKEIKSILCVAAASSEFSEIKDYLELSFSKGKIVQVEGMDDYVIEYTDPKISAKWHLAGLSFQGQTEAAVKSAKLYGAFKPTITMMVGMCMGMPTRNYPVGTVIVPNEVIGFDHVRVTNKIQYRPHGQKVSSGLHTLAKLVGQNKGLTYKIIFDKGLASANSKIENPRSQLIRHIEKTFPDAAAYDMEGWGFFSAIDSKQCLWIKGVADSGESQLHDAEGQEKKNDVQKSATNNAISFAVEITRAYAEIARDLGKKKTAPEADGDIFAMSKDKNGNLEFKVEEEVVTYENKMQGIVMDVVKVNAHTHMVGIRAEHAWLHHNYEDYKMITQRLSTLDLIKGTAEYDKSQIHFDIIEIEMKDGRRKEVYFDISSFFMPGLISSLMNKEDYAAKKIESLY